jgi:hypothetical protein
LQSKIPLGEPLRTGFARARVGLSAPSPSRLRRYGGSAAIPLAKYLRAAAQVASNIYGYKISVFFDFFEA